MSPGVVEPPWDQVLGQGQRGVRIAVHVRPKAKKTGLLGFHAGRLSLAVKSPPEGGQANREVEKLLAELLGLPWRQVQVVGGRSGRDKLVEVEGLSLGQVYLKLQEGLKSKEGKGTP